jgi:hypothetical protein
MNLILPYGLRSNDGTRGEDLNTLGEQGGEEMFRPRRSVCALSRRRRPRVGVGDLVHSLLDRSSESDVLTEVAGLIDLGLDSADWGELDLARGRGQR